MSTNWEMDCTGGHGTAAAFVVEVNVYVDDQLVATRTNHQVEHEEVPWTFSVPLALDGTHTVRVTDVDASGPTEYVVLDTTMVCSVATTTTAPATTAAPTTAAPTTVAPTSTLPFAVTAASVPPTVSAVVASTVETATTQAVSTTATALAETITAAPATLPATGADTGPMIDLGLGFLAAGVVAIIAARRPFHFR